MSVPITKDDKQKLIRLGDKLKAIRNEKGMTLKDLAYTIGKDPQSIHRLEVGGINPSYLYLSAICKGLEIEISELLSGL